MKTNRKDENKKKVEVNMNNEINKDEETKDK